MSVVYPTSIDHPTSRIVRAIEQATDFVHAQGDDDLRAQGFTVTRVPGWFGLLTHRQISHPSVKELPR